MSRVLDLGFQNRSLYDVIVLSLPTLPARRGRVLILIVGLFGGVVGSVYMLALRELTDLLGPDRWSAMSHLIILVAVGITVGLIVHWMGKPDDVELLVNNIHVNGGNKHVRGLRSLIPISLLCVAAGGTLGPEAPLVTTTGTLGSILGRRARLSTTDIRVLSITGMAAGFTVLFGAPLGSAVFALEILHRKGMEYYEALMPAVVGSLCGYAIALATGALGMEPIWSFPSVSTPVPADLLLGVLAGVGGALVAVAFTYLAIALRWAVSVVPVGLRPLLGGLLLAALAAISPFALTNGEYQMQDMTTSKLMVGTLLLAAGVKLVAAAVALVCGWRGGFIIPLFFVGFALGRAAEGHLGNGHVWVLVTGLMVACNVGVTKTPLGSTLVVTEMAGFVMLPTTLTAAMVALLLTSGVGLIETQRRRLGVSEEGEGDAPPAPTPTPGLAGIT